ncbi:hypothetical protein EON63_17760 [archaeon]|nr:MAG: hypothetical protein EON63_17760 [archaeon]
MVMCAPYTVYHTSYTMHHIPCTQVIESDELSDLAVLKTDLSHEPSSFSLQPAVLGDSRALHAGDWVVAVGCPHGLDFTVTLGRLTYVDLYVCMLVCFYDLRSMCVCVVWICFVHVSLMI